MDPRLNSNYKIKQKSATNGSNSMQLSNNVVEVSSNLAITKVKPSNKSDDQSEKGNIIIDNVPQIVVSTKQVLLIYNFFFKCC